MPHRKAAAGVDVTTVVAVGVIVRTDRKDTGTFTQSEEIVRERRAPPKAD